MKWFAGILVVAVMAVSWVASTPADRGAGRRVKSTDNLRNLATMLISADRGGALRAWRRGARRLHGKAYVLGLVASGAIDREDPRQLRSLFSPHELPDDFETFALRYRRVTWEALHAGMDVSDLTSYAGPRRGVDVSSQSAIDRGAPLFADVTTHPDHAIVAFADGGAASLDRKALGLGPHDPLVVGPASKSPLLQMLSFE